MFSDGGVTEDGSGRREQMLADELPALAKEVARVETVRSYAGELTYFLVCFPCMLKMVKDYEFYIMWILNILVLS